MSLKPIPDLTAPKRGHSQRSPAFTLDNTKAHRAPESEEARLFGTDETKPCHFCKTTILRAPRLNPPLATTAKAIPLSAAGCILLGDSRLACPTCAMERDHPSLIEFLALDYVHVLAWHGSSDLWNPMQIARWARIVYGWAAGVDARRKDDPSYKSILPLREWPNLLLPTLCSDTLSIYPIWSAPQAQRGLVERFIKDFRMPFPLPKSTTDSIDSITELNLSTSDPCESAWLSQAWAHVVQKSPDLWHELRGHLILLPTHHLCYDPNLDARSAIMGSLENGCHESYRQMASWAGWLEDGAVAAMTNRN